MTRVTDNDNSDYVGALDTAVEDVHMMPTPADAAQELSGDQKLWTLRVRKYQHFWHNDARD